MSHSAFIVQVLLHQIELDNRLDKAKVELSKQDDFNLIEAFSLFDREDKGFISSTDLLVGLTNLNLSASTEDLYNFLKRYDRLETGRLKYSDFCDAFIP